MSVLFSDTVTLYRRNGDIFERVVMNGVQWRQKIERINAGGKLAISAGTSVTIPGEIDAEVHPGDVMVLGIAPELTDEYTVASLRAEHETYCTVQSIADNRNRPKLKHRRVTAV